MAKAFVEDMHNEEGDWTVPNFKLMGKITKDMFMTTERIKQEFADYETIYEQDEPTTGQKIGDEINY
jgi:hypothetical protein